MATRSNIFAWRIPWTEEPGRLQPMGSQESNVTERLRTHWFLKSHRVDFPRSTVGKNPPPMQGVLVQSLAKEYSTCHRATKPTCHDY